MSRLRGLEALRLFAAACVLEYHLWYNYLGINIGHPGTDFFFVLAGLVAAYSQGRYVADGKWTHYIAARGVRLYVSFVPLFLIALFVKRREATWDWFWRSFFFLPMPDRSPVIGPTWMLAHFLLFCFLRSGDLEPSRAAHLGHISPRNLVCF